ncbi:MAG: hypothetical protein LBK50_01395 [Candidatus Nomurabacteria bacterium]|jgi:hypothetical protein|nr:hypothetical protein [Candidatus Nomurabacteria bacterium]
MKVENFALGLDFLNNLCYDDGEYQSNLAKLLSFREEILAIRQRFLM